MANKCPKCGGESFRPRKKHESDRDSQVMIECSTCGRFFGYEKKSESSTGDPPTTTAGVNYSSAAPPPGQVANSPVDVPGTEANIAAGAVPKLPPVSVPKNWLFVSKHLHLWWAPNEPLYSAPVVFVKGILFRPGEMGSAWFYRLTPAVVVWLEAAGRELEALVVAGKTEASRADLDGYVKAMDEVWLFAAEVFTLDELAEARKVKVPTLPPTPRLPYEPPPSAGGKPKPFPKNDIPE